MDKLKLKSRKCDLVGHICDNVMWYVIYLLPFILLVVYWCRTGTCDLSNVMSWLHLDIVSDNIVYTSLADLFGATGLFPIFTDNSILVYFSYFILVFIVHICVDILLFLPRWAHHIINHGFGGADFE